MEYETKSLIIDRKKDREHPDKEMPYIVEVKLFAINDPHLTGEVPTKTLEFADKQQVLLKGFEVGFYAMGADVVINNCTKIKVTEEKDSVVVENLGSVV